MKAKMGMTNVRRDTKRRHNVRFEIERSANVIKNTERREIWDKE